MGQWDGLEEALTAMVWLSILGAVALLGGGIYGLWWLFHHVSLVVR